MSSHIKTMIKALLLAVMITVAGAARAFPASDARRAVLEYDEAADDATELGNSDEAVELESHHAEVRPRARLSPAFVFLSLSRVELAACALDERERNDPRRSNGPLVKCHEASGLDVRKRGHGKKTYPNSSRSENNASIYFFLLFLLFCRVWSACICLPR